VRRFVFALLLTSCGWLLPGATLERLSLDDMIVKSTAVVRGTVVSSQAVLTGGLIYTHYQIRVTEAFKGRRTGIIDVAVPGGVANGIRQAVSGAPEFQAGEDCVFFLWTSKAGLTQVIGLTQGIFQVTPGGRDPGVTRVPSHELMLDKATHRPVQDATVNMKLSDLRSTISNALGAK
jgi:hypothetical protein